MPTYEYVCENGHHFEQFQRISHKPRSKCPTCGAKATRKISGGAGLVFKGSGFYITDYGKDGKGARKQDAGETSESKPAETKASDGGGSEKAKTEPKPEKVKLPKPHGKKQS